VFQQLTIRGLGPHADFTAALSPSSAVEVSGPSECGKSTLIEAVCLALWGCGSDGKRFRAAMIREGVQRAEVILESAGGGVIRRVVERRGKVTRSLQRRGKRSPQAFGSEKAFARAIGPLGLRGGEARLVLAPLQWTGLTEAGGKKLRHALLGFLPTADLAPVIATRMAAAGFSLPRPLPADPLSDFVHQSKWTEKQAVEARRAARKATNVLTGRLGALEAAADRDPAAMERAVQAIEAAFARAIEQRDQLPAAEGICPTCKRPGWVDTLSARETAQRAVDAHRAQLERARADLSAAEGAVQSTGADLETCRRELAVVSRSAEHMDALVGAIRAAPSDVLGSRLGVLEPLGPVSLVSSDEGTMSVLIDGRPWWLASRGRLVVADLWLRAALRRALAMPWLPLFVDNVQDVGGQPLPVIDGPAVYLRTTDQPLQVRTM